MKITKLLFCLAFMMTLPTLPIWADNKEGKEYSWVWSKIEWASKEELFNVNIGFNDEIFEQPSKHKRKRNKQKQTYRQTFPGFRQSVVVNGKTLDIDIVIHGFGLPLSSITITKHDNVLTHIAAIGTFCAYPVDALYIERVKQWKLTSTDEYIEKPIPQTVTITEEITPVWLVPTEKSEFSECIYEQLGMKIDSEHKLLLFYCGDEKLGELPLSDLE